MTRFDAPASPSGDDSVWRDAGRLVMARFGILLATFVPTTVALVVVILLLDAGSAVPVALRQVFVASPVLVFVAPGASRRDTDALESKLTALPHVAAATLRPKEDALAALVATGVPAPTDGRNPLPDVWTVTLRGDGSFFTTEAVTVRDAISAFPAVDQVRYDEAWVGSIDRAAAAWARSGVAWLAVVVAAIALAVLGLFVLAARALALDDPAPSVAALALLVFGIVVVAALVAFAGCRSLLGAMPLEGLSMKAVGDALSLNVGRHVLAVFPATLLLAALGLWFGHRPHRSKR